MSGFQNVTGFAPPTSFSGFMSLLQNAAWRGVPFHVTGAVTRKGRKLAMHEYPFRDGGWAEDLGRAQRVYSFTGYLIGDLAPAMQLALDAVAEEPGPGLLIHPTIGAVRVSLLSCATSVRRDAMRVIEVQFEFVEQGDRYFPSVLIATAVSVLSAAASAITACGTSLGGIAASMPPAGANVFGGGVQAVTAYGNACLGRAADPGALTMMAAGLPAPEDGVSYGRYGIGHASSMLPPGTTVADLKSRIALQRAAVATVASAATVAVGEFSADSAEAVAAALDNLAEATRLSMTDPADQVRVLSILAGFTFAVASQGSSYLGADQATVSAAIAAACRRVTLASLARAAAAYQPASYQDAATLRETLATLFDTEITAAGDGGEDDAYSALNALRAAVVADLTARGASLPRVTTVQFRALLPSLTIAQMLYRDASRSDQITREANPVHPAFCPISFQALAA